LGIISETIASSEYLLLLTLHFARPRLLEEARLSLLYFNIRDTSTASRPRKSIAQTSSFTARFSNMSEILNANPAIRNASDLPSRRRQASPHSSSKTSLGLFSSTVPPSAYAPDPFTLSTSSASENSDDDDAVEPIDEQEIYGRSPLFLQFGQ